MAIALPTQVQNEQQLKVDISAQQSNQGFSPKFGQSAEAERDSLVESLRNPGQTLFEYVYIENKNMLAKRIYLWSFLDSWVHSHFH